MPPPTSVAAALPSTMPAGSTPPTIPLLPALAPAVYTHPSLPDPPSTPMLLSPSFPPIPAKLVAKVKTGSFVAMKEFLTDNIALIQRLDEVHQPNQGSSRSTARMREISSPIQWAVCLLTYAAVRCTDPDIRNILAYGRIVLNLAQRHGGQGWLEYDRAFRQQAAADHSIQWNSLNPSLMAATVLSSPSLSPAIFCPHCQEADHKGTDCALVTVDPFLEPVRHSSNPPSSRPRPYNRPPVTDPSVEVCRRFNRGSCLDHTRCRYRHSCSDCQKVGHGAFSCPLRQEASRPKPLATPKY